MVEAHPGEMHAPEPVPPPRSLSTAGVREDPSGAASLDEDSLLLERVRRGDEAAFAALVDRHAGAMLRFAHVYTVDTALAEDVVQEVWMAFLRGVDRIEGRAALRTWLCRILLNRLRTRLKRDGHLIPFSALFQSSSAPGEPAVEPDRFLGADHARWPHHWRAPPESWGESPEERLLARETRAVIDQAVAALPAAQREVITLRDIEGWTSDEVCNVLEITGSNQRVLLHRARSRVRRALEAYLKQG